jgi:hypothetical protein
MMANTTAAAATATATAVATTPAAVVESVPTSCKVAAFHLLAASRYLTRATAALAETNAEPCTSTGAKAAAEIAAAVKSAETLAQHIHSLLERIDPFVVSADSPSAATARRRPPVSAGPAIVPISATVLPPPPPPALKTEPDSAAVSAAIAAARATISKDCGRLLRDIPTAPVSCAPVVADEMTADPIPHAPCLQLGGREEPEDEPSQRTADRKSLVGATEEQDAAKHGRRAGTAPLSRKKSSMVIA